MADLLSLSARFIDEGIYEGPESVNRPSTELSEIAPRVAVVEAFSHVVAFDTGDGLVLFDTSLEPFAPMVLASLRRWSTERIHTLAYTHGHIDHIGGAYAFVDESKERGDPSPAIVAHEALPDRFSRYQLTNGYNFVINSRQFGRLLGNRGMSNTEGTFGPARWLAPTKTFRDSLELDVGDVRFELHHARGETDDHLFAWVPGRRAVCVGDFIIWNYPNAGNPQKVQRYPLEWARALRDMAALEPELLLPAHGLPVGGAKRVRRVLEDTALALESVVSQTLEMMNEGATLDAVLHTVRVPTELLERPYLRPMYDEPEFVVRNTWRLYGGWYDGNPANLKPAKDDDLARAVADAAGGAPKLVARARELAEAGDFRLACHLVEYATRARPNDADAHAARAEIYMARRKAETSLMAKGIYRSAATDSQKPKR